MNIMSCVGRAIAAGNAEHRVFDWEKAAKLIKDSGCKEAMAGLQEDMKWTSGLIWQDGEPVPKEDTYTYLSSNWAMPVLVLDDGEEIPCWKYISQTPGWVAETYWPEEALEIVK